MTLNHWARPIKSTDAGSIDEYGNDWTTMQVWVGWRSPGQSWGSVMTMQVAAAARACDHCQQWSRFGSWKSLRAAWTVVM